MEWPLEPGDLLLSVAGEPETKFKNQADLIHTLRGRDGNVTLNIKRKGKDRSVTLPVMARPRMIDWVGLHFSGIVVGKELMRDANLSNPHDEIFILDVASASIGSVLGITAYSYVHTVDGSTLKSVQGLCAYLKKAENEKRKVQIVTRSRKWEYMSASTYKIFKVHVKDVKLVGPRMADGRDCDR